MLQLLVFVIAVGAQISSVQQCIDLNCGVIIEKCQNNMQCAQYIQYCKQGCPNNLVCQYNCMSQYNMYTLYLFDSLKFCGELFECFGSPYVVCSDYCLNGIQQIIFENKIFKVSEIEHAIGQGTTLEGCSNSNCICAAGKEINIVLAGCI